MKIVNVGIYVKDIEKVKAFFEHYFNAKVYAVLDDEKSSYYSYILALDEGAFIELMNKPAIVDEPKDPNRTGIAHININVDSREKLDEITKEFKQEGYVIQYEPTSPEGPGEIRAVTIEDILLEVSFGS
ncbi:MAG: VOC family protein [Lachnospiraceae bacterium]|nr:VOC family protein [Lachnospiraceae bacterium]